jgi:hypothetical protein
MTETRQSAINFLLKELSEWPATLIGYIGPRQFQNWRFVETLEGEIVFGNCIEPCITYDEMMELSGFNGVMH